MTLFKVNKIIDGDTIIVSPDWKWNAKEGNIVRIFGYLTPGQGYPTEFAKNKLIKLLLNKEVELKAPFIPNNFPPKTIACRVFINSVDVSRYFPEFNNF